MIDCDATGVTAVDAVDGSESPMPLVATTVNVYAVPFVNPGTTHVVAGAVAVQVAPPGPAVTVYPVIALPPSFSGAVHDTVA